MARKKKTAAKKIAARSVRFDAPQSRNEAILQNILGANNVLEAPQSRNEAILQAILNGTSYTEEPQSRIEELLLCILNGTTTDMVPQSRNEEILIAKINGGSYDKAPQSRIEELLIQWLNAAPVYVEKTVKGNPISIADAIAAEAVALSVAIEPIQEGTGDPSPENIRPITGHDSVSVVRTDGDGQQSVTVTVPFGDVVYGGALDVVKGELVVDRAMVDLGSFTWISEDNIVPGLFRVNQPQVAALGAYYGAVQSSILKGTTPRGYMNIEYGTICLSNVSTSQLLRVRDASFVGKTVAEVTSVLIGQQLVYELATPITLTFTPQDLALLQGDNVITSDGEITLTYKAQS
jgi:hypothetical protein